MPSPPTCSATTRTCASGVRTPAADGPGSFQPDSIVLRYLDRYGDGLTGHPVVRDQAGRAVAVVDRTNNVIEQSFAIAKQGLRRRLGRAQLGRDLEDQPAQAALAANLRHPDYVRILCGTLDQLPRAFAELDRHQHTRPPRLQRQNRDAELRRPEPGVGRRRPTLPASELTQLPTGAPRITGIQLNSDAVGINRCGILIEL